MNALRSTWILVGIAAGGWAVGLHSAPAQPPPDKRLVIARTGQISLGFPRVFARLYAGGRPLVGVPLSPRLQQWRTGLGQWYDLNLAEMEGPQTAYTAVLDTGADSHVIPLATAQRFGLQMLTGIYGVNEGFFGTVRTWVSAPYGLALAGSRGRLGERPEQTFVPALAAANFSMDDRARTPVQLIRLGGMNLIGMPAIRRYLFEIDPSAIRPRAQQVEWPDTPEKLRQMSTNVVGPEVRIHPSGKMPTNGVFRLPLRYVKLTQVRMSLATGPSPDLSENPVLVGVRATASGRQYVGNWLLDTGCAVSLIAPHQAVRLGWTPRSTGSLSVTNFSIRDITGESRKLLAMTLDKLEFRNPLHQILEFQDAQVLVQEIRFTQTDGSVFRLDGVIGNNLLLPALENLKADGEGEFVPAPFKKVWLDGFRAELGLEMQEIPNGWDDPPPAAAPARGRR